ncbi:MAG: hypothetical protein HY505_03040 [Candidatus Yanofskybacteria bacterium]|nr:hypothetical protein [Candidatus Yanofskybacteria bacterium]
MQRVLENTEENERQKRAFIIFNKKEIKTDLDTGQKIDTKIIKIFGQNGKSMEKLIEYNDKPQNEPAKESELNLQTTLIERAEFTLVGTGVIDGHNIFVLEFKAKDENLKPKNRYEKALNYSEGRVYVDANKMQVLKMNAWSVKSYWAVWLFVRVHSFAIEVEQEERFGVFVPKKMVLKYSINTMHDEIVSTYDNFRDLREPTVP